MPDCPSSGRRRESVLTSGNAPNGASTAAIARTISTRAIGLANTGGARNRPPTASTVVISWPSGERVTIGRSHTAKELVAHKVRRSAETSLIETGASPPNKSNSRLQRLRVNTSHSLQSRATALPNWKMLLKNPTKDTAAGNSHNGVVACFAIAAPPVTACLRVGPLPFVNQTAVRVQQAKDELVGRLFAHATRKSQRINVLRLTPCG